MNIVLVLDSIAKLVSEGLQATLITYSRSPKLVLQDILLCRSGRIVSFYPGTRRTHSGPASNLYGMVVIMELAHTQSPITGH